MPHGKKFYLDDIPLDEAWRRFNVALEQAGLSGPFPGEMVGLDDALAQTIAYYRERLADYL